MSLLYFKKIINYNRLVQYIMNGKCAMDNINENIHLIGVFILSLLLIIVIIYFYKNIMQKHCDIIEKYETNTAMDKSNNYKDIYPEGNYKIFKDLDKETIQKSSLELRDCQVYFVGDSDRTKAYPLLWKEIQSSDIQDTYVLLNNSNLSTLINDAETVTSEGETLYVINGPKYAALGIDKISVYTYVNAGGKTYLPRHSMNEKLQKDCDTMHKEDKRNTCKYIYEDGWKEIDMANENKYDKKIYNKEFTNTVSQKAMNVCFKDNRTLDPKYAYTFNDMVKYNYKGDAGLDTIGLSLKGSDTVSGYINMNFMNAEGESNYASNYSNILDNICSLKYRNNALIKANDTFIKFNLTSDNTIKDDQRAKIVRLNSDFKSFEVIDENPSFISNAIYAIKYKSRTSNTVTFYVFKNPTIKSINNIDMYKFNYNYLCDGKITSVEKKNGHFHVGELLSKDSLRRVDAENDMTFDIRDLSGFEWNKYKTSVWENQYYDILKDLNSTYERRKAEITKQYMEGFTNYKEHFSTTDDGVDCSGNWKDCPCDQYPNAHENCPALSLMCLAKAQRGILDGTKDWMKTATTGKLTDIMSISRPNFTNACGVVTNIESRPFDYKKGFCVTVVDQAETSSIRMYGSVRGLNQYGVIIKSELFEEVKKSQTMMRKLKYGAYSWRQRHDLYLPKGRQTNNKLDWVKAHGRRYDFKDTTPSKYTPSDIWRSNRLRYHEHSLNNLHRASPVWLRYRGKNYWYFARGAGRSPYSRYSWYYSYRFVPPLSCPYMFHINSDDGSHLIIRDLDLNTDESKSNIIYRLDNGGGHGQRWAVGRDRRKGRRRHAWIHLDKGRRYQVEMSMTEFYGGDNMHMWVRLLWRGKQYWINHTRFMNITESREDKEYPTLPQWRQVMDGSFVGKASVPSGRKIQFSDVLLAHRNIHEVISRNTWELARFKDPNKFLRLPSFTNSSELEDFKKNIKKADEYYTFLVKRVKDNELEFKVVHKLRGLNAKAKSNLFNNADADTTKSAVIKQAHIDIMNAENDRYFRITDDQVKQEIGPERLIEGYSGKTIAVTGFIFLDKGYYKFKTNPIEKGPGIEIADDGFYVNSAYDLDDSENKNANYIILNNGSDIAKSAFSAANGTERYDYKILVSGFYKGCYNTFVYNGGVHDIEEEDDALEAALKEQAMVSALPQDQFMSAVELENEALQDELGGLKVATNGGRPRPRNPSSPTARETEAIREYNTNSARISTIIERLKVLCALGGEKPEDCETVNENFTNVEGFSNSVSSAFMAIMDAFKSSGDYIEASVMHELLKNTGDNKFDEPMEVGLPASLLVSFSLKADYKSLEYGIEINNINMNDKIYSGKKIYSEYLANKYSFQNLFSNISSFDEVYKAKTASTAEGFTNYKEHFTVNANNVGSYLEDTRKHAGGFGWKPQATSNLAKTDAIIADKLAAMRAAIRSLSLNYRMVTATLSQSFERIPHKKTVVNGVSKSFYFPNPIPPKYNQNLPVLNIINNKMKPGSELTSEDELELNSLITYEKIPNINDRTPALNNINFNYKDNSTRSFYVSTRGIL
jgi:hypothetical protein